MSPMLKRVGAWSYRYKWVTVAIWVIILAGVLVLMQIYQKPGATSLSIPGTEAQLAIDKLRDTFPAAGNASGRIVFKAPDGKTLEDYKPEIEAVLAKLEKGHDIDAVVSPFAFDQAINEDHTIGFATVQLSVPVIEVVDATSKDISAALKTTRDAGLTSEMNGDVVAKTPSDIVGIGEIAGVVLALVVLAVTFRSLLAAGVPLLIALIAVGLGAGGLYSLSGVIEVDSTSPVLAIMLGLAVGIDYSLFIVSRYRRYLREGYKLEVAGANAIATAGNAVIFAASTVVIALAALTVVQIPFMTTMGLAAAATVAVAAIVSVTLTPAILSILGLRVFRKKEREPVLKAQAHKYHDDEAARRRGWHKWGEGLQKNALLITLVVVAGLAVAALPVRDLQMGLPTDQHADKDSTERKAYNILESGFGAGFNGPLLIFVEGMHKVTDDDVMEAKQQILASQPSINPAILGQMPPEQIAAQRTQLETGAQQLAHYSQLQSIANSLVGVDNVEVALPIQVTDDGSKGLIQIAPKSGPSDQATVNLIEKIRSDGKSLIGNDNVELAVTGTTAIQVDIDKKLAAALPVYLSVVVGISFLILVVAFRSILVPIKATLGFLLTIAGTFGALVVAFQWGWLGGEPTPIVSFLPIISIGILFGLAMDYEFFMVSSIHEAYEDSKDAKKAVVDGFAQGAKVVVAAAAIMTAIFAGFFSHDDEIIRQIGFALAVGVFIDAFIVRMTLVPALMSKFGKAAWWLPRWLDRILPRIAIEGDEK
ncbi:MAG: MMPL family transporter [Candidatus Saccharimonadales bacterium]